MFVVTFDEDDSNTKKNRVFTVFFGPDFKRSNKSRKDNKVYNHYSLLRTIEDNVSVLLSKFVPSFLPRLIIVQVGPG